MGASVDDFCWVRCDSDNVGFQRDDDEGQLCRALGNNPRLPIMSREELLSLLRAERAVIEDEIAALRSQQRDAHGAIDRRKRRLRGIDQAEGLLLQ